MKSFSYKAISSIETGRRFMGSYVSFLVSNNEVTVKWADAEELPILVAFVQEQISPPA